MTPADFFAALNSKLGIVAAIVTALGTIIGGIVKVRANLTRSRLKLPNAFPLPEVPGEQAIFDPQYANLSTMLVGRDHDIHDLTRAIQNRRLNFLYGESGSGKSTLLKLGIARQLNQSGAWISIYLDIWGQDWIRGPRKSLADSTDFALRATSLAGTPPAPVTEENVFSRLGELRSKTGRRPVLLFDQLDDYQNQHRAHFRNAETGLFLTPDELCAANPFWRDLRSLLLTEGDVIHVLFCTRDDAESGLHCFRFEEPGVYPPLGRLAPEDASLLIQRLAPEAVVSHPENGFNGLIERLVSELSSRGGSVLPMQLRVALAGIGRLTGPLTPSRIDREGGASGLTARYIESVIRDTAGALPVLNAMARRTAEGHAKAVSLTRKQLEELLPGGSDPAIYLERLVSARVLRCRLAGSADETWQLYHDYLADAIVALDRRRRKYSLLLEEAQERYRLAEGLRKWSSLLTPQTQIRLLWRRWSEPDFRFAPHAGFVRLSLVRLVVNVWTLAAVAVAGSWLFWSEGREAEEISRAFLQGGNQAQEFAALWQLAATRSGYVRRGVFQDLLSTNTGRSRLAPNSGAALAALGPGIAALDDLRGLPFETCSDSERTEDCVARMIFPLAAGDTSAAADRILNRMKNTTDVSELSNLGEELAVLAPGLPNSISIGGADAILARMKGETQFYEMNRLGSAMGALADRIPASKAAQGAGLILTRMQASTSAYEWPSIGFVVEKLLRTINGDDASALALRILELMNANIAGNDTWELTKPFETVAHKIPNERAAQIADQILDRMKETASSAQIAGLGSALAALDQRKTPNRNTQGASLVLDRMKQERQFGELTILGSALASLTKGESGNQAAQGASLLLERLKVQTDSFGPNPFVEQLNALAINMPAQQAAKLAVQIQERTESSTKPIELSSLETALPQFASRLSGKDAGDLAGRILDEFRRSSDAFDLTYLGTAWAVLSKGPSIAEGVDVIVKKINATATDDQLSALCLVLGKLVNNGRENFVAPAAAPMLEQMKRRADFNLYRLAAEYVNLDKTITVSQATETANLLLNRMARTGVYTEVASIRTSLAKLAANFPQLLPAIADRLTGPPAEFPCDVATASATRDQLPLLIDMLKWPTCGLKRNGVMLRIAELQGKNPAENIGTFDDPNNRASYRPNLREFIAWLKTQRGLDGKSFDLDSPPVHDPFRQR